MALTLPPDVKLQAATLDFLRSSPKKLLIGGEWVDAANGDTFASINPATGEELAQAVRVDIAGELEAIIGYEAHAVSTTDERAKKVLYHIADEERRHVGELQQLLYILSPKDAQYMEQGKQKIQAQQSQNFQQFQ